ncbi:hypothetical protein Tco_0984512 [Tanacetum coccineum]
MQSDREFYVGFIEWDSGSYDVEEELCRVIDKAVPLGHVNGARFKAMIRKELEGHKIQKLRGNSQDRLDSYSFANFAEFAAVMP